MNDQEINERLEELESELQDAVDALGRAEADLNDNDSENVVSPEYILNCKSEVERVKCAIAEVVATMILGLPFPLI